MVGEKTHMEKRRDCNLQRTAQDSSEKMDMMNEQMHNMELGRKDLEFGCLRLPVGSSVKHLTGVQLSSGQIPKTEPEAASSACQRFLQHRAEPLETLPDSKYRVGKPVSLKVGKAVTKSRGGDGESLC